MEVLMKIIKKSYWINPTAGITTKLCSLTTYTAPFECHTEWYFEGHSPLPVMGKFKSSYSVLYKWLKANGWKRQNETLPASEPDVHITFT